MEKAWAADEAGDQAKATMFFEIVAALGKAQASQVADPSPLQPPPRPPQQHNPAGIMGSLTNPSNPDPEGQKTLPIFSVPTLRVPVNKMSRFAEIGNPVLPNLPSG
ncbi:hypothetical protein PtA15_7A744 [Puccinia triticina]|uniref:Uncharacterized protein n=1 Tax=Puccinia triticina TaxID=208348 RepID=A0ABY7CQR3_9BASI|nr:uncharacterized protein PtA15_7A744 [Puccinia triticina]WAQ87015.1 hypothetical protein PtA15_7A744 [Puccinia triticina]